jgi:hypothetical protein
MKQENKLLNNLHIFIQFEIKIFFQNEMQNLVEFVHLKTNLSYSSKVNMKNVMYWTNICIFGNTL